MAENDFHLSNCMGSPESVRSSSSYAKGSTRRSAREKRARSHVRTAALSYKNGDLDQCVRYVARFDERNTDDSSLCCVHIKAGRQSHSAISDDQCEEASSCCSASKVYWYKTRLGWQRWNFAAELSDVSNCVVSRKKQDVPQGCKVALNW